MINGNMLQFLKLNIINTEHCQLDSSWHYNNVYGPYHRLYLTVAGEGVVTHHEQKFHLKPGVLHLVPGFSPSSYRCDSHMDQYYVHFACDLDGHFDLLSELPLEYQVNADELDHTLFERLLVLNPDMGLKECDPRKYNKVLHFQRAMNYANEVNIRAFIESKAIMLRYLARFLKHDLLQDHQSNLRDYPRIENAIRFIRKNISQELTVKQLADMTCFSSDHFSKVFKLIMGVRPIEYIHRIRLQRVKLLLLTTEMSLEKIATEVGFSSVPYIIRIFRKYTGTTPLQYRKNAFHG